MGEQKAAPATRATSRRRQTRPTKAWISSSLWPSCQYRHERQHRIPPMTKYARIQRGPGAGRSRPRREVGAINAESDRKVRHSGDGSGYRSFATGDTDDAPAESTAVATSDKRSHGIRYGACKWPIRHRRCAVSSPGRVVEHDYQTFCDAVGASSRGRAFLQEYARRNRHADTEVVLAAPGAAGSCCAQPEGSPRGRTDSRDPRALLGTIHSARPQIDFDAGRHRRPLSPR